MEKIAIFLMAVIGLAALSGCATLTRGTTESYSVVSDPPGALATFSSGETCITPCEVKKKRNDSFAVKIEKDGYAPFDIQVNNQSCDEGEAAMVGNLLMVGSILWASIDGLSGATRELTPNPCEVKLAPLEGHPEG